MTQQEQITLLNDNVVYLRQVVVQQEKQIAELRRDIQRITETVIPSLVGSISNNLTYALNSISRPHHIESFTA